jgi:hypothetical protein
MKSNVLQNQKLVFNSAIFLNIGHTDTVSGMLSPLTGFEQTLCDMCSQCHVHIGFGAHSSSYIMDTVIASQGVRPATYGATYLYQFSVKVWYALNVNFHSM